jgi:fucose permease
LTRYTTLLTVVLSYLIFIVLGIPTGLLNVGWPSISNSFAVPVDALGLLLLASTTGYLIASFFIGQIIARLDIPLTLFFSTLAAGLGLIGYALSPSWLLLLLIAFVASLGKGTIDAGLNVYFAQHHSPRLMNWLHAAFGLGAVIGPVIMTAFISQGASWRWGYLITAGLMLVMALSVLFTRARWQSRKPQALVEAEIKPRDFNLVESLSQPLVWLGILVFFVYTGIEVTAPQWGYTLFTEGRGVNIETAGLLISIYWASFTIGRVFFGVIVHRIPLAATLRVCMLVVIAGSLLMWQNISSSASFLGLALMGFALAPVFPLLISDTPNRLGAGHANNAIGFQVSAASLGIAILPGVAGVLAVNISLEIIGPFLVVTSALMLVLYQLASTRRLRQARPVSATYPAEP